MPAAALIQLGIAALPLIQVGVAEFIAWLQSVKAAAQQTGEWTDEQEAAFRAALFAKTTDPAYAPDP
jgi:hypothetical protein